MVVEQSIARLIQQVKKTSLSLFRKIGKWVDDFIPFKFMVM